MPETLILCGGEEAPLRSRGKAIELDLAHDAPIHKRIDFQSDQISAGLLDDLPDIVADALEVAVYVYSADRLVKRKTGLTSGAIGSDWQRKFRFKIPVRCPDVWLRSDVRSLLIDTLSFLSGDVFEFEFTATKHPMALEPSLGFNDPRAHKFRPDAVMLFSGGLDSLAGVARDVVGTETSAVLVTHQSANALINHQNRLARSIAEKVGSARIHHAPVRVRRGSGDPIEHSQRLRSFLFATLGLAYARMFGLDTVRFYENGITSFNLPVAEHVLGTRASRTTHPRVLSAYSKLFSLLLDAEAVFDNPFLWMTKTDIVKLIQAGGCADLIPETTSCAAVRNYSMTGLQCGTCSQCVERRIAMVGAGLDRPDLIYECDMFLGPVEGAREMTMIAGHLLRARNLARVTPDGFVANHGQILRALPGVSASPDKALEKVFRLHQRYGREFEEAVNRRLAQSATIDDIRVVSPQSLLGILLPTDEPIKSLRDPAELEITEAEAPPARIRVGTIVVALDADQRSVLFVDGPFLKAKRYKLFSALVQRRDEQAGLQHAEKGKGYVSSRDLASDLGIEEAALRRSVSRLRIDLARQFEACTGYTLDDMDIIESKHWKGYRLNPNVLVVDAEKLRAQTALSRKSEDGVTQTVGAR